MEEPDQARRPQVAGGGSGLGDRLTGAALSGALLASLGLVVILFISGPLGLSELREALRVRLASGGWLMVALMGASAGTLLALRGTRSPRQRFAAIGTSLVVLGLALALMWSLGPAVEGRAGAPLSPRARTRAILKGSFQSPLGVARILPYARDPDATVREQAVLALGVNLIVKDIERASERWPAKYAAHPLRDSLRVYLLEALRDASESIRAQAARALWKAPRTFGNQSAAAETLAAVLDRAARPGALERLAWLALDAAAGAPHPGLKAAAARFAQATADTELARVAVRAAGRSPP